MADEPIAETPAALVEAPPAQAPAPPPVAAEGGGEAAPKVSFLGKFLKKPFIFILAGVLGVSLGGGGYFLFFGKKKEVPKAAQAATEKSEHVEEKKEAKAEEKKEEHGEEKKAEHGDEKKEGEHTAAEGGEGVDGELPLMKLDSIVVNIPDKNSIHYLKLSVEAACSNAEVAEEIKLKMSQLKDTLLFIASDKSLREILTSGGKNLLKDDIQVSFNKMLKKGSIKKLYFTEFTIQ